MLDDFTRERLAGWVADVVHSDALAVLPGSVREHAEAILLAWLEAACTRRDVLPEDWELADLREALLATVARLDLPPETHRRVPDLCRLALAELEAQGRVDGGRALGLELLSSRAAYERTARGEVESLTRPGPKIGRNEPCPCGSGRKYKVCCARR